MRWCLPLVIVCAWSASAFAYRPFDGTDADVAGHHELELELSPLGFTRQSLQDAFTAPAIVVNYGFASGWEIVLEGREIIQPAPGTPTVALEDTLLSVKHVFREGSLQGGTGTSIAVEASVLLPTSTDITPGAELALIVSERWDALTIHLNGATTLTRAQTLALFGSVILEGPDRWTVRPISELYVEGDLGVSTELSALGGVLIKVSDDLTVDLAVRVSDTLVPVGSPVHTLELRGGVTWTIPIGHDAARLAQVRPLNF